MNVTALAQRVSDFRITIDAKKILGGVGTALLGVFTWLLLSNINHSSRLAALENDTKTDARQDEELREIRKTIQDLTVLFFKEHPPDAVAYRPPALDPSPPPELDTDKSFNAVQMDVERAVRAKGLEPAKTAPTPYTPPK